MFQIWLVGVPSSQLLCPFDVILSFLNKFFAFWHTMSQPQNRFLQAALGFLLLLSLTFLVENVIQNPRSRHKALIAPTLLLPPKPSQKTQLHPSVSFCFFNIIWLHHILAVARGIIDLHCGMRTLSCGMWDLVPCQGSNQGPLPWELGVLATGSPQKSSYLFISIFMQIYRKPGTHANTSCFNSPEFILAFSHSTKHSSPIVRNMAHAIDCHSMLSQPQQFSHTYYAFLILLRLRDCTGLAPMWTSSSPHLS